MNFSCIVEHHGGRHEQCFFSAATYREAEELGEASVSRLLASRVITIRELPKKSWCSFAYNLKEHILA